MSVFVLDQTGRPLMPCSEKRARLLLSRGRAVVHRVMPMVIRLKDRRVDDCQLQAMEISIDPGSKETGIAVRASGSFNIQTGNGVVQGVSFKHCKIMQRGDGYGYAFASVSIERSLRHPPKIATTLENMRGRVILFPILSG